MGGRQSEYLEINKEDLYGYIAKYQIKIVMYYSKIRSSGPASLKLRSRIIGIQGTGVGLGCRGWRVGEDEGDTSMSSLVCTDLWVRQGFQSREELVKGILKTLRSGLLFGAEQPI